MRISYKKLWKLLIDREMKKKELAALASISPSTISKLGRDKNVSTEVIGRICEAMGCDVADIMEYVNNRNESRKN